MTNRKPARRAGSTETTTPTFRSAAVARLANMPVATLRIWEQRYAAVRPATAASGHRLYTQADVQRVLLLRQLTERGHAIGSIAPLDTHRLGQVVAAAQAPQAMTATAAPAATPRGRALRLAVAGPALAMRLQRALVGARGPHMPRVVSVFETLADATGSAARVPADLLLCHAPELRPNAAQGLRAARDACRATRAAVIYRYAATTTLATLAEAGMATLREPLEDAAMLHWLAALATAHAVARAARADVRTTVGEQPPTAVVPARRYDDATLTTLAGLPQNMSCECPRHVAELLLQLASFESYSAGCANRSHADAELHAYLHQVAGTARALFEDALESVAQHEGLPLP